MITGWEHLYYTEDPTDEELEALELEADARFEDRADEWREDR